MDKENTIRIQHIPASIVEAINNNQLVLFIGAGVSSLCGLPLWNSFANKALYTCYKKEYINYRNYNDIKTNTSDPKKLLSIARSIYMDHSDLEGYNQVFLDEFDKDNNDFSKSAEIVFNFIINSNATVITTNADRLLDKYYTNHIYYRIEDINEWPREGKNLIKIHGSIDDPDSLVFTTEQYIKRYNNSDYQDFLKYIFDNKTVLFIGYGLSEFELLDYVIIKADAKNKNRKIFVLNGYCDYQVEYEKYMKKYYEEINIEQLVYYMDNRGYDELANTLELWFNEAVLQTNLQSDNLKNMDMCIKAGDMNTFKIIAENNETLQRYGLSELFKGDNKVCNLEKLIDNGFLKIV